MEQELTETYATATRVIALCPMARTNEACRRLVQNDVRKLIKGMRPNGGWRYDLEYGKRADSDNSASQYVVLALREAAYVGIEIPTEVWEKLEDYWRTKQAGDGGWDYGKQTVDEKGTITPARTNSYGSMTAAGLASCYIILDMLLAEQRGSTPVCRQLNYKPIDDALAWFDKNFKADTNPGHPHATRFHYYLYNIERIGAISGRKYFGKHDWYKEIAEILLAGQKPSGAFGEHGDHCWATIFLAKAQAQVVINKLEFHDLDWDVHSRDVANLVRDMSDRFERLLNWQIVDMRRDVREIRDAPVLFLTGSKPIKADAEEVAKLRQYLLEGGTLLAQAACGSPAFAGSLKDLCRRALPEYEMRPLAPEHPVFSAHASLSGASLMGVENGVRTCVFFLPQDVSFFWHRRMSVTKKDAFDLGVNVVVYAMDKSSFRGKRDVTPLPKVEPARRIPAALLRHPAGWNANLLVLDRLSDALTAKAGIGLDVKDPVDLGKSDLTGTRLLWISGYNALNLPDDQQQALAAYVKGGGTLFIDAANGSKAFTDAATALIEKLLPEAVRKQAASDDPLLTGRFTPAGFNVTEVQLRRVPRLEGRGPGPELICYSLSGRLAVVLSPLDVSSGIQGQNPWACRGYEIDSARQIGVNVALQLLAAEPAAEP
jgi:hypothetical protein